MAYGDGEGETGECSG